MINIGNGLRARSLLTYLWGYLKVHFKILAKTSLLTYALSKNFVTKYPLICFDSDLYFFVLRYHAICTSDLFVLQDLIMTNQ